MRAFVIHQDTDAVHAGVESISSDELEGDVLIDVTWAGVNFKDAMMLTPGNRVARRSPLIPGVELAGIVRDAPPGTWKPGDVVIAHGHGIGVSHHGGFAEQARLPHEWVLDLPTGLSAKQAMALGTAGFTAMASVLALEEAGLRPGDGPVLVTGAAGGVGSTAVAIAAARGHAVTASTGRLSEAAYLRDLGATEIIGRSAIDDAPERTLAHERWAGAIDCVGGSTLTAILRSLSYGAAVAASGLTGGNEFTSTVFPFIVRGVSLIGIDAVETPTPQRRDIWDALAASFPSHLFEALVDRVVGLEEITDVLAALSHASQRGRVLVDPQRSTR